MEKKTKISIKRRTTNAATFTLIKMPLLKAEYLVT